MPSLPAILRRAARVTLGVLALVLPTRGAAAQVRELPVPFDTAGRVLTLTPPLVARLGLAAPVWPVAGDFIEARLYRVGDSATSFVIVVRRQREVLERFPIDAVERAALAGAIARSTSLAVSAGTMDTMPTVISEPVRGQFVVTQTALGLWLFAPAAAGIVADPAGSTAAYLAVAGGTFFWAASLTQSTPVSRAQNHLAAHSALRGAIAANLALFTLAGDDVDGQAVSAAILLGGIAGDVVGFQLAKPMTDAEAHGTSHGSTVVALTTAGLLGATGAYRDASEGQARLATAAILAAGVAGYPLGLRYVRTAPYRVTAGDVSAMFTAELLGVGVAASLMPEDDNSDLLGFGLLTAGYVGGAIVGDRLLVRKFDHTESEARLLALGTAAGATMGIILPTLADADWRVFTIAGTAGGILGAMLTESLIKPARAGGATRRTGSARFRNLDVSFSPQGAIMASSGMRGNHSLLSLTF
jgi:hypothetical protein